MSFISLKDRLPSVRGKMIENAPLATMSWFRVGGPAQALFIPADAEDLSAFLSACPEDIPVTVLGAASNVIIRDGGVAGVVVRLGASLGGLEDEGAGRIRAGAAVLDKQVAKFAQKAGIGGLEFFAGVPGAIGGALRMNAGCYGKETKDVLIAAKAMDRSGQHVELRIDELGYGYRSSTAAPDLIFYEALFQGAPDDPDVIAARMDDITARREASQPIREKTGGSTFANPDPPGTPNQRKCWELIDKAGGRGLRVGAAMMSEQHCNFMINTGEATAAQLEALGEEIRRRVLETSGVELRWEIKRIGLTPAEAAAYAAA